MFDLSKFSDNLVCILPDGHSHTYSDLQSVTERLCVNMDAHTLVFCMCENNFETLVGYVSFTNNGNVVLMLDSHMEASAFQTLFSIYKPSYIWTGKDTFCQEKFKENACFGAYVLYDTGKKPAAYLPEQLSVLLTTSGSTGSPKLVRLSKENLLGNARSIVQYLHITQEERPITSLPMYYSYGLSVVNSHLLVGATLLLTGYSYIQKEFWDFARRYEATSFSGIPYTYEILKKLKFWTIDLPSLRTLTQAGGKLSNELLQFFIENARQRNVKFYLMYGQTEATARMSYLPPEYGLSKLGSIGYGIPGGTFSLADEDGNLINGSNVVGELVYQGGNVSLGYAETFADLYKGDENHGILHTGDLAYRDDEGFYFITGRKKRFLKLFGNRISLEYVEMLLAPYLKDCVCVGNDTHLIVYTTDRHYDETAIINVLVDRTKILRKAFIVRQVDAIPRSNTGKVLYKELSIE